jgi:chromosome segregation ATPase
LKAKKEEATLIAARRLKEREIELEKEIEQWQGSHGDLSESVSRLETECANLAGKNSSLLEDLESLRDSLSRLEKEKMALIARESALNTELQHLKDSLGKQSAVSSSEMQLKEQFEEIQSELSSKAREVADLTSQLSLLQQRLATSEGNAFKHTKDLARIEKERNQAVLVLEKRAEDLKRQLEEAGEAKEIAEKEYEQKISSEKSLFEKVRAEHSSLKKEHSTLLSTHNREMQEQKQKTSIAEEDLRLSEKALKALEEDRKNVSRRVSEYTQQAKETESSSAELLSTSRERDVLREALVESKATMKDLQDQAEETENRMKQIEAQSEREIYELQQERDTSHMELRSVKEQLHKLTQEFGEVASEKTELDRRYEELWHQFSALETETNLSRVASEEEAANTAALQAEIESLKRQVEAINQGRHSSESKYDEVSSRCSELEDDLKKMTAERNSAMHKKDVIEKHLMETRTKLRSASEEKAKTVADRDQLAARCRELDARLEDATNNERPAGEAQVSQQMLDELTAERDKLQEDLNRVRSVSNKNEETIQDLERHLLDTESLLANRDQTIVILKEHQSSSHAGFQDLQKTNKELVAKVEELEALIYGFDEERQNFSANAHEHAAYSEQLNKDFDNLAMERNQFLEERDRLEEENEEMLIQFGIVKQQMDANQDNLISVQGQLAEREGMAQEADRKLREAEARLEELAINLRNQDGMVPKNEIASVEQKFVQEKADLQLQVDNLSSQKEMTESELHHAQAEKSDLLVQVERLEEKFDELLGSSSQKEKQLVSIIEGMEVQARELTDKCYAQERNLTELREELEHSRKDSEDAVTNTQRIDQLEHMLSDHKRMLEQKDAALKDMKFQLEDAGRGPVEGAEMDNLRQTVRSTEETSERDRRRIQELESISRERQEEVERTRKELFSADTAAQNLQSQLAMLKQSETLNQSLQTNLQESQQELASKAKELSRAESEAFDLRRAVSHHERQLQDSAGRQFEQATKEPSGQASAEVESLRQQIETLKTQQLVSSSQTGAREEMIEAEVHELQREMRTKDGQISHLEREVHSLGSDLSDSRKELASKKQHVEKLSLEILDLRSQAEQQPTSRVLALTHDEAESVDTMRSQIISLAQALEKSETRRASAIERLEKERQTNADSLRRLTESVKRFYSTLSYGD